MPLTKKLTNSTAIVKNITPTIPKTAGWAKMVFHCLNSLFTIGRPFVESTNLSLDI
jgi:hypothetical protein